MPYPFAHPAAVLPLAPLLGRYAVPSALAIGSVAPDLWYFVPLLGRAASHSPGALLWFCLPAGLAAYLLFHLVLKEPLIALVSPRLAHFACAGLPRAPWRAVIVSLLAGALTHIAWDALTHAGHNLQHASTAIGTLVLAAWIARRLGRAPPAAPTVSNFARLCVLVGCAGAMAIAALWAADIRPSSDLAALRHLARTAGIAAVEGLGAALFLYCLAFQRKMLRRPG